LKKATILGSLLLATCSAVAEAQTTSAESTAELNALSIVIRASNPTAKLAAAEDYLVRYPNSSNRIKIAEMVAAEIEKVPDGSAALTLIDRATTVFKNEPERNVFKTVRLDALIKSGATGEAFRLASQIVTDGPADLVFWIKLTFAGADEAKRRNSQFTDLSLQYGTRAIRVLESDRPPAGIDETAWLKLKPHLGSLYQATAILYLEKKDEAEATLRIGKAIALNPADPTNYALRGRLLQASDIETASERKTGRDYQRVDQIIEDYARAAALATGRPEYQKLLQQLIPDLTNYYKTRNHDSTAGLQQTIDKYRIKP